MQEAAGLKLLVPVTAGEVLRSRQKGTEKGCVKAIANGENDLG